jgi:hypothetical protein
MDVHAASIVKARMMDPTKPQPPETYKPADFLARVPKLKALAVPPA